MIVIAALLLLLVWALTGCSALGARSTGPQLPRLPEDNTARLIQHPQFPAAAAVAPEFVNEVFSTLTRLEAEAANK